MDILGECQIHKSWVYKEAKAKTINWEVVRKWMVANPMKNDEITTEVSADRENEVHIQVEC